MPFSLPAQPVWSILHTMRNIYAKQLFLLALACCFLCLLVAGCGAGSDEDGVTEVEPVKAREIIDQRRGEPQFVILDIRTPKEFKAGHIEGAINIDHYGKHFRENLDMLNKDATYLLYCRSGGRTGRSLPLFRELGFVDIIHLTHGIRSWKEQALPLVTGE